MRPAPKNTPSAGGLAWPTPLKTANANRAVRHQHYAAGRCGAGAAGHLYDHRAGAAVRHSGRCARTRTVKQITQQRTVVTIDREQRVYLDDKPVNVNDLPQLLHRKMAYPPANRVIYLRADESSLRRLCLRDGCSKQAGITNISIVTRPIETLRLGHKQRCHIFTRHGTCTNRLSAPGLARLRCMLALGCAIIPSTIYLPAFLHDSRWGQISSGETISATLVSSAPSLPLPSPHAQLRFGAGHADSQPSARDSGQSCRRRLKRTPFPSRPSPSTLRTVAPKRRPLRRNMSSRTNSSIAPNYGEAAPSSIPISIPTSLTKAWWCRMATSARALAGTSTLLSARSRKTGIASSPIRRRPWATRRSSLCCASRRFRQRPAHRAIQRRPHRSIYLRFRPLSV